MYMCINIIEGNRTYLSSTLHEERGSYQQTHTIEHAITRATPSLFPTKTSIATHMFQNPYASGTPSHRMSQRHRACICSRGAGLSNAI